ncbi:hypothetical protein VBM87_01355 [Mycoplasma sp. 744]|uniref:hypothetical protein n=1 Tax=Mycoplasma sp. 744 TaxID=3108531 RepID=UPI002B1D638C|nr:hypothetical protein [Mycoplasma sp. 744]MEA4115428.1 hypothetical protein [Mycoplasma sp. 744]
MFITEWINKYFNFNQNNYFWYIPLIFIALTILIAFIIGFKKGFWKSIGSLIVSTISWIAALPLALIIFKLIQHSIVSKFFEETIGIDDISYNEITTILKPLILSLLIVIVYIIIWLLFSLIFSIIAKLTRIKKLLTRQIKPRKRIISRFSGGLIKVVSTTPFLVYATNVLGFATGNNFVDTVNNKFFNVATFNQAKGISDYLPGILIGAELATQEEARNNFTNFFAALTDSKNFMIENKVFDENISNITLDKQEYRIQIDPFQSKITETNFDKYLEGIKNAIEKLTIFASKNESTDIFRVLLYSTIEYIDKDQIKQNISNSTKFLNLLKIDLSQISFTYKHNLDPKVKNITQSLWMFTEDQQKAIKETFLNVFGYRGIEIPKKEDGNINSKSDEEKYMYVLNEIIDNVFFAKELKNENK